MRSEPFIQFVFDELKIRGWPVQGKQVIATLVGCGLSISAIRNWKEGEHNPKIETWLTVLDALGYKVEIVPK